MPAPRTGVAATPVREFTVVLTPQGELRLEAPTAGSSALDEPVDLLQDAFLRGPGYGLFHLGAVGATSALPPVLAFWRDVGRVFMTALCTAPDLDGGNIPIPVDELTRLVESAPPMPGGEYLSAGVLEDLLSEVEDAFRTELETRGGDVQELLRELHPVWNRIGRVHFHLAEQKGNEQTPFAFLATYTTRLSRNDRVQHRPLGKALEEYAGARNRKALLALLRPVHAACEGSAFLRELVDSGRVFHPLGWTPRDAYRFLKDIPCFESHGILVRVPDWWQARRPSRPRVEARIGSPLGGGLGSDALLEFSVDVVLDGDSLSAEELDQILQGRGGLALIRGRWVEIDGEKLGEVLDHWKALERKAGDGLSFIEGLRLLAGVAFDREDDGPTDKTLDEWSSRVAGGDLAEALAALEDPDAERLGLEGKLEGTLRAYQKTGVSWLKRLGQLGLGACLADDMGLGKTIQILALLLLHQDDPVARTSLLVVPASLIGNWQGEIGRFAPGLRVLIAHPSAAPSKELRELALEAVSRHDLVITSYGFLSRLGWAESFPWDCVILDEAQAIKNRGARQTRAVKRLEGRRRIALTGTPVENRLSDLWSIFDFLNPGLLGTEKIFRRFAKGLEARERDRYAPLRRLIRPYILRRLKTDRRIIDDLPDKTEVNAYCTLTRMQAALYQESVKTLAAQLEDLDGMKRRGVVLAFLTRLKQICNHPSQWLRDDMYRAEDSGKFVRLGELCETLAARQEKVLVFTQYREIIEPLSSFLAGIFGRPGLVLHGQVPVKKRAKLVERFQESEEVPFFVLSLKAGGTGLNLTSASQVIHFDRWWNPAVENQATDRAFRIGQKRNVLVHKFVCRGTVEEKIDALIQGKQRMSADLLGGGADVLLTEMKNDEILDLVSLDIRSALEGA